MITIGERLYQTTAPEPSLCSWESLPTPSLFHLPHLCALSLLGDNAATFLQGQVTCDVLSIAPGSAQKGALCNLQGRVMSLFYVITQPTLMLILPHDMLETTIRALKTAALLSGVKLQKNEACHIYGLYHQKACAAPDLIQTYLLSPQQALWLVPHTYAIEDTYNKPLESEINWHQAQLHDTEISIYSSTQGLFLPQALDLDKKGYISFDKGCYKGQEIIARMHYRGKRKHHLACFTYTSETAPVLGAHHDANTHIPHPHDIVDYCPVGPNTYLVAVIL
ncbi:MAG: hypothetical protein Q8R79_01375 [Legionellaceae bacterium]|nr:hypothetical protein [Legionellaceae bacterium]